MPPHKKSPKDSFAEYGLRLLDDAENSTNPELVKLRTEIIGKLFEAHVKGNRAVSPYTAALISIPVFLVFVAVSFYSAEHEPHGVFFLVFAVSTIFAIIYATFMLLLCGKMGDTLVAKIFTRIVEKIWPTLLGQESPNSEGP